ncbi:MAG: SurA N-terminal domain-containing protein [Oligoflexia bacterium]|nr:SurA N-terminal domain-containing protein [Oligoflexia bacterium]
MSGSSFQKKTASIIASVLIGFIILSFMFSGYYTKLGGQLSGDSVASVDGLPIKAMEYQRLLADRTELMKKLLRVQDLSSQQLEQFNIKQGVLQSLIDQKLILSLAYKTNIIPSDREIAEEIQKQPYFKIGGSKGEFDVTLYKNILAHNGYTPSDYEKIMADELRAKNIYKIISSVPISQSFLKERLALKNDTIKVQAIQISKDQLKNFLEIPQERIEKFANDPANQKKIDAYFQSKKSLLNQPEEVEVRHILVKAEKAEEGTEAVADKDKSNGNGNNGNKKKTFEQALTEIQEIAKQVTTANFAQIADEKTEDLYGKGKGGLLGWIQKGQMVPEFEKVAFALKPGEISPPTKTSFGYHLIYATNKKIAKIATLAESKRQMALELIQKEALEERKKLEEKITQELKNGLETGAKDNILSAQTKYKFQLQWDRSINILDDNIEGIPLTSENSSKIFGLEPGKKETFVFNEANDITIIHAYREIPTAATAGAATTGEGNISAEKASQQRFFSEELRGQVIKYLRDHLKIKVYSKLIGSN